APVAILCDSDSYTLFFCGLILKLFDKHVLPNNLDNTVKKHINSGLTVALFYSRWLCFPHKAQGKLNHVAVNLVDEELLGIVPGSKEAVFFALLVDVPVTVKTTAVHGLKLSCQALAVTYRVNGKREISRHGKISLKAKT